MNKYINSKKSRLLKHIYKYKTTKHETHQKQK